MLQPKRADHAFLGRTSDADDIRVTRAQGSIVVDARGKRYIDFYMGWCVGNLGWGRPELRKAIARFRGPDYVVPTSLYEPWAECAALLAELTPGRLKRSFRATGGTEAVEIAMQAAMCFTGRRKILGVKDAYHGNSIGVQQIVRRIPAPLDGKALERAEALLAKRNVAAFIMEPISGKLGALAATDEFVTGIRAACDRHGTLLIMDEVACGFGRTGKLFATEHYDVEPDILCMAKALTGGAAPMGATIMTEEVYSTIRDEGFDFYSTYGWHPVSVEVTLANLRYLRRHRAGLMRNVEARGAQFEGRLTAMGWRETADIRVRGLCIGVELDDDGYAEHIVEKARRRGLLVTSEENILQMFPALTIDEATAGRGLDILERCV